MNYVKMKLIVAVSLLVFGLASCSSATTSDSTPAGTEMSENTHVCPMHPEEKGKEGDNCSKCGMPLELTE